LTLGFFEDAHGFEQGAEQFLSFHGTGPGGLGCVGDEQVFPWGTCGSRNSGTTTAPRDAGRERRRRRRRNRGIGYRNSQHRKGVKEPTSPTPRTHPNRATRTETEHLIKEHLPPAGH
jgi:hypothetical protein